MTAPTEKAAPIPGDVLALAKAEAENFEWAARQFCEYEGDLANDIREAIACAILADREARPSLPDSREERIREDERDRLYAVAMERQAAIESIVNRPWTGGEDREWCETVEVGCFLEDEGAMFPADRARARQGGNNG